ncbi:MAG: GDP-L-fucose synthase [Spirochaetota bacterium]|nr:GDP-L-fucose synthase [Spirochaetota bacterium]
MNKNSKIFIAGGTGLVGSAIIRNLLSKGYNNLISSFNRKKPQEYENSLIKFYPINMISQLDVNSFFEKERPEYVFLSAAKVGGIVANNTYKADFIYDNIMISSNVIHASYKYGIKKLLNLGSSCIYPKLSPQPMKEEYLLSGALEPTNEPYAIAKIAAIKMCRYFNEQYGTNFISVMPSNLYGTNDNFNLVDSHVLPALIRKFYLAKLLSQEDYKNIKNDFRIAGNSKLHIDNKTVVIANDTSKEDMLLALNYFGIKTDSLNANNNQYITNQINVSLWGTGTPFREFLYVDDLADAVVYLMENYDYKDIGEFINIGSGIDLTIKELASIVKRIVGFTGTISFDVSKPDGTPKKLLDISHLKSLGWSPSVSLEDGITKVYDWYKNRS